MFPFCDFRRSSVVYACSRDTSREILEPKNGLFAQNIWFILRGFYMPVDCSSCLVASSSTAASGVRVCQFRPLLFSRCELVSLRRLSVPVSNFMGFPLALNDQLWNITAKLREELWVLQGILSNVWLQRTFSQILA